MHSKYIKNKTPDFVLFKNERPPNAYDLPIVLKNSQDIVQRPSILHLRLC